MEHIRERIKFETERLRLIFILFLTDVSGTIAVLNKETFEQKSLDKILFVIGLFIAFVLFLFMYRFNKKIIQLIIILKEQEATHHA